MTAPIIWGIATAVFLVLAWFTRTPKTGSEGTWRNTLWMPLALFSAAMVAVTYFWPSIMDDWGNAALWWVLGLCALAALIVGFVRFRGALATVALLALVLFMGPTAAQAIGSGLAAIPSPTATDESTAPPEELVTVDESEAAIYPERYLDILRDYGYTIEEVDGQSIPVFESCSDKYEEKVWTDAVCAPLDPKDRTSVLARILGSPDYAAHVASGLGKLEVTTLDGTVIPLVEINPWLKEFVDPATINDWGQSAMGAEGTARIEYAHKMVLVAILVERFTDKGVQGDRETAYNFHVVTSGEGGSLAVDESNPFGVIPEFELSPNQYRGEFIVFEVTYKGQNGCYGSFGINTGDGRFAGFTCKTPEPVPAVQPEPEPSNPPTDECVQPANPGGGHTWNPDACVWVPPVDVCVQPANPGDGSTWNPDTCSWDPPVDVCVQPAQPGEDFTWNPEQCAWIPFDKPDANNPDEPEGVDPQPQPDPVEPVAPVAPVDPIVPEEEQGDPIPPADDGTPDVPVDGDEGGEAPAEPPAEDPAIPEVPNDGEIDDPDALVIDPSAASLIALPLMGLGALTRRRLFEHVTTEV